IKTTFVHRLTLKDNERRTVLVGCGSLLYILRKALDTLICQRPILDKDKHGRNHVVRDRVEVDLFCFSTTSNCHRCPDPMWYTVCGSCIVDVRVDQFCCLVFKGDRLPLFCILPCPLIHLTRIAYFFEVDRLTVQSIQYIPTKAVVVDAV